MKAQGQPTNTFQRVSVRQNILSIFQMQKPRANIAAPLLNMLPMMDFFLLGIRKECSDHLSRYVIRSATMNTMDAKIIW
jgi:hypothetical protein